MAKYECQMIIRCQTFIEVEAESEHVAKMKAMHDTLKRMKENKGVTIVALPFECVRIDKPRKN